MTTSMSFVVDRLQTLAAGYDLGPEGMLTITVNHRGQIHSIDTKPAVVPSEGLPKYYVNGVEVPPHVATNPALITAHEIERERNVEVRRVMIERYGMSRYLADCGARCIQRDQYGGLYEKRLKGEEAIRFVAVKNSTPEPDGSIKDYFLRVPPDTRTAKAGVAWTFAVEPTDYSPVVET